MRIYLSGPMRGFPDDNKETFNVWACALREAGHEVYNPGEEENGLTRRQYFAKDTDYICKHAEAIAVMPGWESSEGAFAEWALARALGLKVIYLTK